MNKRIAAALLGISLIAAVAVSGSTARAQEDPPPAPTVPEVVQIEDPAGDANFLNDQDNTYGQPTEGEGDHVTPQGSDLTVTDFLKIWFSNTADTISLHILTEAPPPASNDTYYRIATNPGSGSAGADETRGCIFWIAVFNGSDASVYQGDDWAQVEDTCNVGEGSAIDIQASVVELSDGTGLTTLTAPRSYSPLFAAGGTISKPFGVARVLITAGRPGEDTFASAATSDTTKRGSDYLIVEPDVGPPGKSDPPGKGKKKGCPKGKGKKKGACPGAKDGKYRQAAGRMYAI